MESSAAIVAKGLEQKNLCGKHRSYYFGTKLSTAKSRLRDP